MQHPTVFLRLHLLSGFQYKAYGGGGGFFSSADVEFVVQIGDFRSVHILRGNVVGCGTR
jgi:hypothetical protein